MIACGQPDVEERLRCTLAADGTAEITFEVSFPESVGDSQAEADEARGERIEDLRRYYFEGWDPWAERFEQAGHAGETLSWERVGGSLRTLTRTAHLADPEALAGFFADTDLTVLFSPGREESEVAVFAGSSSRATGEERERLEKLLAAWSRAAVDYLHEVANLYAYLDDREERAQTVFRAIFEDSSEGLRESEEARLDRLLEAFLAVLEIAETTDEQGVSLEQLARRVYDPFPARLSVAVEGRILARAGFVELADGAYEVPALGLERALGNLEAQWIEPPLLTTYEHLERLGDGAVFDLQEFAARPRRVSELPSADEVVVAVEEALTPEPEYRLRWRPTAQSSTGEALPPADR